MATLQSPLKFTGHKFLAHRLVLSTLLGKPIHVSSIRANSPTAPGLAPHEISLLRMLETITNGSQIEISYTGTTLLYRPGLITGSIPGRGADANGQITHTVDGRMQRGITYLLVPLLLLAPFSKSRVDILFTGPGVITSSVDRYGDISVDTARTALLPVYTHFGLDLSRSIDLRTIKRSNPSTSTKTHSGAGEVHLVFGHQLRLPRTIHLTQPGKIQRIRGTAYATGISPSTCARLIASARAILNPFCTDIYISSDTTPASLVATPTKDSPSLRTKIGLGFGLSLVAESTNSTLGVTHSSDAASGPSGGETPELIAQRAAYALLENISHGGVFGSELAPTVLILMAMGSEDVGRVVLGKDVAGAENTIGLARDMISFGGAGWGVRDIDRGLDAEDRDGADTNSENEVVISIVGRGVGNVGRKIG